MTDLETHVEALMQTLHTTPVSWEGSEAGPNISVVLSSDVRALVISLVQEKADLQVEHKLFVDEVVAAELMIDKALDISGPVLCQNVELLIDAKEAAEARLAAVKGLLLRSRLFVCIVAAGKTWKESSLATEVLRDVDAALTPSRRDMP